MVYRILPELSLPGAAPWRRCANLFHMPPTSRQLTDAAALFEIWLGHRAFMTRTPGVSYAIHAGGKTLASGAFGFADLAAGKPATVATGYRCASITKTVTATLIMQLVEQSKVRLDEPVATYLPWARPALASTGITIRHLLLHAGGVVRDGSGSWSDEGLPTREQIRADVLRRGTFAEPSVGFRYSNVGYSLLGEVIERVTGKDYAAVVDGRIARPLKLSASGTTLTPRLRKDLATGYFLRRPGEEWRAAAVTASAGFEPAGGLISNVEDLCRYQDGHMPGDERLLSDLSKREMQRTQWQRSEEPHHGYAWMLWTVDGVAVRGHSGGYPGFVTRIGFAPALGVSAAVLTNTVGPLAELGIDGWYHTLAMTMKRWEAASAHEGGPTRSALQKLAGKYRGDWSDLVVGVVNNSAFLIWPDEDRPMQSASRLSPKSGLSYVIADESDYGYRGEELSFEVDARGRATAMRYGPYYLERVG
jgi:D-alanyl-D-alanine carboxypeptidase